MKIKNVIKNIAYKIFIGEYSNSVTIYNYIKYDEECDADIYLIFIAGQRGYIDMGGIDHTETSMSELRYGLEEKMKLIYNLGNMKYTIQTIIEGEETPEFVKLKEKALEPLTWKDKFKSFVSDMLDKF